MALSKVQTKRLGLLLSVMFNEDVPVDLGLDGVKDGWLESDNDRFKLSKKGLDEKNRLCTLAGLNIKYQSERTLDEASNSASNESKAP